jgi:hypothetical protein
MREFFKGWRRKAGCVTLVLAGAILIVWMRSQLITDTHMVRHAYRKHYVVTSKSGCLEISSNFYVDGGAIEVWSKSVKYLAVALPLALLSAYLILWKPRKGTGPEHA